MANLCRGGKKVEPVVKELDLLKVEEQNITEEIELSNQMLASAIRDIKKACQMIARAQVIYLRLSWCNVMRLPS